jgi:hypothetical protein
MDEQKWHLIRGIADCGLRMEHQICKCVNPKDERDIVAYVPSIQPYCIGASMADKEYAREQANNAVLISEAPALKARVEKLEKAMQEIKNHCRDANNADDYFTVSRLIEIISYTAADSLVGGCP